MSGKIKATKARRTAKDSAGSVSIEMDELQHADALPNVDLGYMHQTNDSMGLGTSTESYGHNEAGNNKEPTAISKTLDVTIPAKSCLYAIVPHVTPKSFTDLPGEIKEMIYREFFRPDAIEYRRCTTWPSALGCTKVLGLSRGIRADAMKVFECLVPPTLALHGRGRRVFRNMFSHGTPGMFKSYPVHISNYIPPALTELAFLRLRKVEVVFRYEQKYRYTWIVDDEEIYNYNYGLAKVVRLRKEVAALHSAVQKSKSLVHLHFTIQTGAHQTVEHADGTVSKIECEPVVHKDYSEYHDMLRPLVAAGRQRFHTSAETNKDFRGRERGDPERGTPYVIRVEHYEDPLVKYINNAAIVGLDGSPLQPELPPSGTVRPFERASYPQLDYQITPECRQCYLTFCERAELDAHLAHHPKHCGPFAKKRYNDLNKKYATTANEKNKCRTCAISFESLVRYEKHCQKHNHMRTRRQGIVGRWKRDNHWYKCTSGKTPYSNLYTDQ